MADEQKKAMKIKKPSVLTRGDNGDYKISVYVPDENDEPVFLQLVKLEVSKPGCPAEPPLVDWTDPEGFVEFDLKFNEVECDAVVRVRQYEEKLDNLLGPSRHRENNRIFWWHLGITIALVVFGLVLGFNRDVPMPPGLSPADIAYIRLSDPQFGVETVGRGLHAARSAVWWITFLVWLALPVTFVAVFRDDLGRGIRKAIRSFREGRGEIGGDERATREQGTDGHGAGFLRQLMRFTATSSQQTITAALADWLTHRKGKL